MEKQYPTLREAMQKIVGTALSSVDFVEDYVQLVWEKSVLTAYSMPALGKEGLTYGEKHPEYRDVMYRLEGQVLDAAEIIDAEAVNLAFVDGTTLSISIREDDYVCPEILLYREIGGLLWVV